MIYFIRSLKTGNIKIGTSNNAKRRVSDHRTEQGEIELLGLMEGDRQKEQELLKQFRAFKANYRKEWFIDVPDLRDFISQHCDMPPLRVTRSNRGRKPVNGRTATINIKVSKETHEQIQEVANILNKTHSEVISLGLKLLVPNLEEEKMRRRQLEEDVEKRIRESQN